MITESEPKPPPLELQHQKGDPEALLKTGQVPPLKCSLNLTQKPSSAGKRRAVTVLKKQWESGKPTLSSASEAGASS